MGQILHGSAKTRAIRSELRQSQASIASLAKRYGINEKTVLKWRHRQSVEDKPMGPRERRSTIVALRIQARLPLMMSTSRSRTGGRFAAYCVASNGELQEFVVNGPDADPYVPTKERRAFIERMMDIAAPATSRAERAWAVKQLDSLWIERLRPLPVQVGDYVFTGIVVRSGKGAHDSFRIVAAGLGITGLK